jgi:L-seryl-tRNA(Ser) seleniumtransferase
MGARSGGRDRTDKQAAFRWLPAVEEALRMEPVQALEPRVPRELLVQFVREVLDAWRAEVRAGELDAAGLERRLGSGDFARAVGERVAREERSGLVGVVNATGVVLHTGLGRAPVHPEAAAAMAAAAGGYGVLEVDRETGERGQRDDRLSELLVRLTGAEAGICVNNNAAAVLLTLSTFGSGDTREVVVSRGELVEIGGSFRLPAVMERAGSRLREVGTTNRTRMDDYRSAAGPRTGLFLKVHTSNFKVQGFVHEVSADELATLGQELGVTTCFDLGSGLLECAGATPLVALADEPRVRDAVSSGVDVVTFSGDKLLGGPQAGLIVGKRDAIGALRKNPVYRAMRLDKVTIAGLERTLELYLEGRADEIPGRAMMLSDLNGLRETAQRLARSLSELEGFSAEVGEDRSQPGSGSAPGVYLDTWVVRVRHAKRSAGRLGRELRRGEPSVFARIHENELVLDPRTLLDGDEERLLTAFRGL